jgi:hypothetical protein
VDPRTDLYDVERRKTLHLSGLELRTLGRPARSQSLYRRRYLGSSLPPILHITLILKTFKFHLSP